MYTQSIIRKGLKKCMNNSPEIAKYVSYFKTRSTLFTGVIVFLNLNFLYLLILPRGHGSETLNSSSEY